MMAARQSVRACTSGLSRFAVPARAAHFNVPVADNRRSDDVSSTSRRAFTYALFAGGGIVGAHVAKTLVNDFLDTMSMSADVKALAQIEVDLGTVPEGANAVMKWQGKPLFVRNRTAGEIEAARSVDQADLPDPAKDEDRLLGPDNWLVLLGICTHLGCVPLSHTGDFAGYFCPCHGSHYDTSGRIRKGPAPANLEIPPYKFIDDGATLVVG